MRTLHLFCLLAILLIAGGCESETTLVTPATSDNTMSVISDTDIAVVNSYDFFIKFIPDSSGMPYQKLKISQAAPFDLTVMAEFRSVTGSDVVLTWNIRHGLTETPFHSVLDESYLPLAEERWIVKVFDPTNGKQLAKLDTGIILAAADGRTWPFNSEYIEFTMNNSAYAIGFENY